MERPAYLGDLEYKIYYIEQHEEAKTFVKTNGWHLVYIPGGSFDIHLAFKDVDNVPKWWANNVNNTKWEI